MADGTRDARTTITVYLPHSLRNRARAAYRATSGDERDLSWSEFVGKAVLAEVERREREHNEGLPYEGGALPLGAGAPRRRRKTTADSTLASA